MGNIGRTILFILHNLRNMNQEITIDSIINNLKLMKCYTEDIDVILEELQNQCYLIKDHNSIALTEKGMVESEKISKEITKEEFNDLIKRATSSETYLNYCMEIYGYKMCLFNMMDKSQLDFLFNRVSITNNDSILDLGCGNGCILNHLIQKYDCHGVGIDQLNSEVFIKYNGPMAYIDGSMDELDFYNISPNITISVDSLYFSSNLSRLLNSLIKQKGNRLYFFYSQYIFDEKQEDKDILKCDNTRLARSLNESGIIYKTVDYSKNERKLYEKAIQILPKYEKAFKQEGNRDIFERKMSENKFGKKLYDKGNASRFLYIIE